MKNFKIFIVTVNGRKKISESNSFADAEETAQGLAYYYKEHIEFYKNDELGVFYTIQPYSDEEFELLELGDIEANEIVIT